jgi:hypothetical protein
MANNCKAQQNFVSLQADLFRLAARDHGLTIKRLSLLADIPATTMQTWASGTVMPAWAMVELARFIPDDLMSLMLEPAGRFVGTLETVDHDLDALGCEAAGFVAEYVAAKADGKVTPIERARLGDKARGMAAAARKVVA